VRQSVGAAVAKLLIRPIEPRDRQAADALLVATAGGGLPLDRGREIIDLALGRKDREYRAVVALLENELVGVAAFGELLGSDRVIRLHVVAARAADGHDVDQQLLAAVDASAKRVGARFIFAEIPEEIASEQTVDALTDAGYVEETRIADYVRDGVPLLLLRRAL
jgi:hypothetical protein